MRLAVAAGLVLVVAIAVAVWVARDDDGGSNAHDGVVARVSDGDTVQLRDGERVRLVQIDAPELGTGECYSAAALRELRRLLPAGTRVLVEPDLDRIDRFGRTLAYVDRDGTLVNLELVELGAAAPWFFAGQRGRYADDLLDAAREAKAERRGLWGECRRTELDPERRLSALP